MGLVQRGVIFLIGTISNAILFVFHSRVLLEVLSYGPTGPATPAMNLLPAAMQLGMGGLQIGLVAYLLGALGEERAASREPMP